MRIRNEWKSQCLSLTAYEKKFFKNPQKGAKVYHVDRFTAVSGMHNRQ
jgi:hypothetical protein